jgi:NADPH:quinone reductase-like Zn-dependent oxidoreductase
VTAPARPGADTMMALRAHARGGPEQLVYEQAPAPVPGPGEALVAVHAAGITFAELTWDLSWTAKDGRDRTPVIPAHELSGTVAGLADGVTGVAVGDEVYALIDFDRDGAAAEFTTVPAAELAAKPRSASHAEAATLPLAALTAWQALADYAAMEPGERVLVHGGAGGVGAFAVQLAAILGGRVTATGRSGDAAFVRDLGAEAFVSAGDPVPAGFDVVIDTVGGAVLDASYRLLRAGGRLVTLSAPPSQERAKEFGAHAMFFVVTPDPGELAQLAKLVDEGRLHTVVSQTFPLKDGRLAFESGSRPRPPGKTVLTVR